MTDHPEHFTNFFYYWLSTDFIKRLIEKSRFGLSPMAMRIPTVAFTLMSLAAILFWGQRIFGCRRCRGRWRGHGLLALGHVFCAILALLRDAPFSGDRQLPGISLDDAAAEAGRHGVVHHRRRAGPIRPIPGALARGQIGPARPGSCVWFSPGWPRTGTGRFYSRSGALTFVIALPSVYHAGIYVTQWSGEQGWETRRRGWSSARSTMSRCQ